MSLRNVAIFELATGLRMPPIMIRCVVGSLGGPFPAAGGAESRSADLGKGFPQASLKKEQRHFAAFVFSLPLTAPRVPVPQRSQPRLQPHHLTPLGGGKNG